MIVVVNVVMSVSKNNILSPHVPFAHKSEVRAKRNGNFLNKFKLSCTVKFNDMGDPSRNCVNFTSAKINHLSTHKTIS